jgi:hypothetical protein
LSHSFTHNLAISEDRKDTAFISKVLTHLFLHGTEIESPTCFPILIPSTPTWRNMDMWVEISLVPSQQQLKNSPNQKTKPLTTKDGMGQLCKHPSPQRKKRQLLMV